MHKILSVLLAFCLFLPLPVKATTPDCDRFTAVISSPNLAWEFKYPAKYQPNILCPIIIWSELEPALKRIEEAAGSHPIFLDFLVHGDKTGLQLQTDYPVTYNSDASFGYVANRIKKVFGRKNVFICFESCFAGAAYKNTIRGNQPLQIFYEDFEGVPKFHMYGAGDNFSVAGPIMMLQYRLQL